MQKKKYVTTAEKKGYSWVLSNLVSDHVRSTWSAESADPWWLAVKGAQWDRVRVQNYICLNINENIHFLVWYI